MFYETNLSQVYESPQPIFDNASYSMDTVLNVGNVTYREISGSVMQFSGTIPVSINPTGHINVFAQVQGFDILLQLMIVLTIEVTIITLLLMWIALRMMTSKKGMI